MKENIKEKTISETKKRPIWKTVLMWIVGILAVSGLCGAVIELFMFFTVGAEIKGTSILGLIISLFIIKKLKIIKYKK